MLKILFEDTDILVVVKPAGIESQSSRSFEPDMVSEIKKYLSTKLSTNSSTRGREPYVGVIHRLDKPVSGVMVYAKTPKAAASLSAQVQNGKMRKVYHAVVCGKLVDNVGNFVDFLLKDGRNNYSRIVDKGTPDSKLAELRYRVLAGNEEASLVAVELLTGRHHQIRVQFAGHGTPIWGDGKYNPLWGGTLPGKGSAGTSPVCKTPESADSKHRLSGRGGRAGGLALSAVRLSFSHPISGKAMGFSEEPVEPVFKQFVHEEAPVPKK